ncbi:MAG TPA: hypothetical protein VFE47_22130 [Tepidisphaeraceae bacterium]|jgi:hypothetical protein|nr:hypothetical protein [Tepidisphaeraceae bacterium]
MNWFQIAALNISEAMIATGDRAMEGRRLNSGSPQVRLATALASASRFLVEFARISDPETVRKFVKQLALMRMLQQRFDESQRLYETVYATTGLSNYEAVTVRLNLVNVYRCQRDISGMSRMYSEVVTILRAADDIPAAFRIDCLRSAAIHSIETQDLLSARARVEQANALLPALAQTDTANWQRLISDLSDEISNKRHNLDEIKE